MPNHVTTILTIEDAASVALADIRKAFMNADGKVDFNIVRPSPECLKDFEPNLGVLSRANAALGLLPDPKTVGGSDITDFTKRLELSNCMRDITTPTLTKDIPDIVRALQNYGECGYMYWYDWNSEHWGTKWNCYGQPDSGHPADATSFEFKTAWAHPGDIIKTLSERVPNVTFSVRYADEDTGSNCGTYRIKAGVRVNEDIAPRHGDQTPAERQKWMEFAFRLRNGMRRD